MDCDRSKRAALRRLTACLVAVAASGISLAAGTKEKNLVCAKPGALSETDKRQRQLDNYSEKSPDPSKTCSKCRFFTAGAEVTACGQCAVFNGPANPQGKCDDWTARPV